MVDDCLEMDNEMNGDREKRSRQCCGGQAGWGAGDERERRRAEWARALPQIRPGQLTNTARPQLVTAQA